MLVLTVKNGESFDIGEATVKIFEQHAGYVKVGIEAPKNIKILREKLKIFPPPIAADPEKPDTELVA